MIKIYHNPRCSKSRAGLAYLVSKKIDFEIVDYMKKSLSASEILTILKKSGLKIDDLLRRKEDEYNTFIKGKPLTENELIDLIISFPNLLQRPIILTDSKAIIANPPELISNLL